MHSYTKIQLLQELRVKILKREDQKDIAQWSYERFLERIKDMSPELEQFLIDLACMKEQEISYDELEDYLNVFYMGDDFVYDKLEFIKEFRRLLKIRASMQCFADWAYDVFQYKNRRNNKVIHDIAYALSFMCCHEFEYSYEELESILNRLIAGEDVKL